MNKLSKSNVVFFPSPSVRGYTLRRQTVAKPVLRAHWRVSATTGHLECTWEDGDAPLLYSLVA